MRIFVAGPQGLDVLGQHPWRSLIDGVCIQHEVVDSARNADGVVSINHQGAVLREVVAQEIPVSRRVLIMLEPTATLPEHGRRDLGNLYSHIFCGSPLWAKRVGGRSFIWPQEAEPLLSPVNPFQATPYRATMVAAQKRSAMASSLYGLRRDVVRTLGNLGIPLGLAGADWLESRVQRWNRGSRSLIRATRGRSLALSLGEAYGRVDVNGADYVGPIADKFAFLQQAPISVVVENSLDYVSEKLFDAIRAGVAPVYVGPPLTEFGIPQEIALVADPLATDVVRRVRDTSPSELAKCIQHGQTWISSSEYQSHESNRVLRSLGEEIGKAITLYDGLEEGTIRRIADR